MVVEDAAPALFGSAMAVLLIVADQRNVSSDLASIPSVNASLHDEKALELEKAQYQDLPIISDVTHEMVMENYYNIKQDVLDLIDTEIEILLSENSDR